jgi:hypothetical protein
MTKIQKHKEKRKKAKHCELLLSFTVQYMWVNNGFLTPFNFYYFIKFITRLFSNFFFNYMRKK